MGDSSMQKTTEQNPEKYVLIHEIHQIREKEESKNFIYYHF